MVETLSRYELGMIQKTHDEQHYKCVSTEYMTGQLDRMGLPPKASRFQVAERIRELERKIS